MEVPATKQNLVEQDCCPICGCNRTEVWLRGPDRFHGRRDLFSLARCSACSMVWLRDPPRPDQMDQHYGPDYDRFISRSAESSPESWRTRHQIVSKYKSSGTLLDIGCSSGSFLVSLKNEPWRLYGVEISSVTANKAEAKSGATVFVGDVLDAPFQSNSFDVVTCFDVLEHLYQPREVMVKIADWLKPGGIFYTLLPNIDSGEARFFRSYWYGLELPRHLSHFSPTSLRYLANQVGLKEVLLETHPNSALEYTARYACDDILRTIGLSRLPLAGAKSPSLPWKIVRKVCRMTVSPLIYRLISRQGEGESIHAIFKK